MRRRNAHKLTAVAERPVDALRGFPAAEALIAGRQRIQEQADFADSAEDACDGMLRVKGQLPILLLEDVDAAALDGEVNMQPIAAFVAQRLGQERCAQPILVGNRAHGRLEGHGVIRRLERTRVLEINLVLPRSMLVVAAFRDDAHVFQRQANIPADVLALVQRRDVKIAAYVQRNAGRVAVLVGLEQVELALAADVADKAHGAGTLDDGLQVAAAVALKRLAVGQGDVAVHADDAALGGAPRQHGGGVRVRPEHKVALLDVHEPGDGRPVEADTLGKGAGQLTGKKRNVFLVAENIAECQFCELNIVVLNKIENVLCGAFHRNLL
mgnify:CR=1 FL=1